MRPDIRASNGSSTEQTSGNEQDILKVRETIYAMAVEKPPISYIIVTRWNTSRGIAVTQQFYLLATTIMKTNLVILMATGPLSLWYLNVMQNSLV